MHYAQLHSVKFVKRKVKRGGEFFKVVFHLGATAFFKFFADGFFRFFKLRIAGFRFLYAFKVGGEPVGVFYEFVFLA